MNDKPRYAAVIIRHVGPVSYPVAALTGNDIAELQARGETWARKANRSRNHISHTVSLVQHEPPAPLIVQSERETPPLLRVK